ncbi:MAG: PHP domain-containing protein [Propionibacteriaceae bacterium]|jgi:predicted metal-dependent phosphoesterase TrpH|nr:PHP domain-containing protein [Propionibacteriaceae bacterium]
MALPSHPIIDLHTHSSVSDGTDTPVELIAKAARQGLSVVSLTDHDTFSGLAPARRQADTLGLHLIDGIELTARFNGASVHLLGYGCDPENEPLAQMMAFNRNAKNDRAPKVLEKLAELGMPLTIEDVKDVAADDSALQRPHIADAMVARGYVASREEAFRKYLFDGRPAFVRSPAMKLEQAIDLVHGAGGVAVIAHPWARRSEVALPEKVLARLAGQHQLDGLEANHPDHPEHEKAALRGIAARLGLLVTGSSDYHGKGKVGHELGCESTTPETLDEILRRISLRRAAKS